MAFSVGIRCSGKYCLGATALSAGSTNIVATVQSNFSPTQLIQGGHDSFSGSVKYDNGRGNPARYRSAGKKGENAGGRLENQVNWILILTPRKHFAIISNHSRAADKSLKLRNSYTTIIASKEGIGRNHDRSPIFGWNE